jgi:16S rRNA G966 N2-methylase RsmD
MAAKAVEALDGSTLLGEECLVVVQQFPKEALAEGLARLALVDRREYGSTTLLFYEVRVKPALPGV